MRRLLCVLFISLLALGFGPGAAAASGPAPGTVVLRATFGARDAVEFHFPTGPSDAEARARAVAAVQQAGLRVGPVLVDHSGGAVVVVVGTTLGRRTGLGSRDLPAQLTRALAIFPHLVVQLPPGARLAGGYPRVGSPRLGSAYAVPPGQPLRYAQPTSRLVGSAGLLLALLLAPLLLGPWARRVERSALARVDKAHRLRVVVTAVLLLWLPLTFALLLTGWLTPPVDALSNAGGPGGRFMFGAVMLVPLVGLLLGIRRGWQPAYLRVRGASRDRRVTRRTLLLVGATYLLLLLPLMTLWAAHRVLNPVAAAVLLLGLMLLLQLFVVPVLVVRLGPRADLDPAVRDRLLTLCRQERLQVRDVVAFRGKAARTGNAALLGMPPSRYVIVTDALVDALTPEQLDAVVAHEIGHGKRHHLPIKLAAWLTVTAALGLAVGFLHDRPGLVFALPVVAWAAVVAVQGLLGIRLEKRADDYAVRMLGVEPLRRALEQIAELNMTPHRTGRLWNVLTQHPGMAERLARLSGPAPGR